MRRQARLVGGPVVLGRFRILGGMMMGRRRLMLAIGAVLLGGGWGATWTGRIVGVGGVISMGIGAGLIGFAVLRPTNRNDE